MAQKIVGINKKTGGKYVTIVPTKNKAFVEVQTAMGVATKSKWVVKKSDIDFK